MIELSSGGLPELRIAPELIAAARSGSASALGELLDQCRGYLHAIAQAEMPPDLQAKAGASDIVQQTYMEAHQDFAAFRGSSETELLAWLRQILLHNLANFTRHYRDTEMRNVALEKSLSPSDPAVLDLEALSASPSSEVGRLEEAERLALAIARLPREQRIVLQLRQKERLKFDEIGQRIGRTGEAVRKLWARAIVQLRSEMNPSHDPNPPSAPAGDSSDPAP